MTVVVALGGNALLRRNEPLDAISQRANIALAANSLAPVLRRNDVVLTHGNGPQVGLLALQNEAYEEVMAYPLDVLGAESEGMIGYLLEQELGRHVAADRLCTLLTQVVVDRDDPAFRCPTKFIGPVYSEEVAHRLERDRRWNVARDGSAWRRVVPSPEPRRIVEIAAIRALVRQGMTVICVGGGGIPVIDDGTRLQGVEAVVDKDLSASLLATQLQADALILLTDVAAVYRGWGTGDSEPIGRTTPDELREVDAPPGSMGPKIEAVCRFVDAGGSMGAIGAMDDAAAILRGEAGTIVRRVDVVDATP
jgi:carbamate kinase